MAHETSPRLPTLEWDDVDAEAEDSPALVRVPGAHAKSVTDAVLACVAEALEVAGVEHFLVVSSRSGSRLGLPEQAVPQAMEALAQLGARCPVQVALRTSAGGSWRGLARDLPEPGALAEASPDDGETSAPPPTASDDEAGHENDAAGRVTPPASSDPGAQAAEEVGVERLVVFADVLDPASGLQLGSKQGCVLAPWRQDEAGGLHALEATPRTEDLTAEDRARPQLVEGEVAVTSVPPFTEPDVFEVRFEVDAVVLWVDGSDPQWRAARDQRRAELGLPPDGQGQEEFLYDDHGELRYLLRSIEQYAPWLRRIHLVTAGQRPSWLREDHPRLRLVDHADIIEAEALPVFSPRPITARMHRIEGLSEHFLYFNDDMVLARSIDPELFFTSQGQSRFFLSKATVPRASSDIAHLGARQVMQRLIADRYGVHVARTFRHAPYALRRSTLELLETAFPEAVSATVRRPFRSPEDIVPEWLHHYVGYCEGRALPGSIAYGYFPIGRERTLGDLDRLLTNRNLDCFCLNDLGDGEAGGRGAIHERLERLFPLASAFEADAAETPGGGAGS